jgi:hypothetical protein
VKHTLATLVLSLAFLGAAAGVDGANRTGALVGAAISGATALLSMLAIGRTTRWRKPMIGAVAVMAGAFLLRIVLVALGTALVSARGGGVVAFVVAFFVPFFVFAGVETAYVHSLRSRPGAA